MATNEQYVITSHNVLNYGGMLFNKGNTATPFSTLIGGRSRNTNHWSFPTSLSYTVGGGESQPAITETASLTAPNPEFVTRTQATNVCQIYQKALAISYGKLSSMGQLSGLNIAGQAANPADELDFQVGAAMAAMRNDIEYTFLNGVYQDGQYDDVAYKTRGILNAIETNVIEAGGAGLGFWTIAELIEMIGASNAPTDGLVLMCHPTHVMQINADASSNGLTVLPAAREINGMRITDIETPFGTVGIVANSKVPKGTAMVFNPAVCAPVFMPVPGKGNFFLEPLSKVGGADRYQIYGQAGLDYGAEWYHGKITGLDTGFNAPEYSRKVAVVGSVATVETKPVVLSVALNKEAAIVGETVTATPVLNIEPASAGTFTYEWQTSETADGTFAAASTLTGYQTATVTAPAEVPDAKYLRCKVVASGTVEASTTYSGAIEIVAAED